MWHLSEKMIGREFASTPPTCSLMSEDWKLGSRPGCTRCWRPVTAGRWVSLSQALLPHLQETNGSTCPKGAHAGGADGGPWSPVLLVDGLLRRPSVPLLCPGIVQSVGKWWALPRESPLTTNAYSSGAPKQQTIQHFPESVV